LEIYPAKKIKRESYLRHGILSSRKALLIFERGFTAINFSFDVSTSILYNL
tara:strand:+ start:184 stop:336 length:153 start_codon:yes stop_codon:yes gene_type:complete